VSRLTLPPSTGHGKPFLLRSELVWTRAGKPFLSQNNWTQCFLARSQPRCQVGDKHAPCCRSTRLVETNNTGHAGSHRPGHPKTSESCWKLLYLETYKPVKTPSQALGGGSVAREVVILRAVSHWFFLTEGSPGKDGETMGD